MRRLTAFIFGIALHCITQLKSIANDNQLPKNHIELSPSILKLEQDGSYYQNNMWGAKLTYSHDAKRYLSLGTYLGIGRYDEYLFTIYDSKAWSYTTDTTESNSINYGVIGKLHLLPLLFKKDISFVDLYLKGELGLITMNSSTYKVIIPARGTFFDFSGMGGCTLYLSKGFGLFAEAGYQQFIYYNGFHARYGLSFRF
jgi:hypothetical protein